MQKPKGFRAITNIGFGKFRLPNLLAFFGLKLFFLSRKISKASISLAIFLNPYNPLFKEKLDIINNNVVLKNKDNILILSVTDGCNKLKQKITFFDTNQFIKLTKPKVINSNFFVSPLYETIAKLPNTYMARLKNAVVFGGTDLILLNNHYALYDEFSHTKSAIYEIKSPVIKPTLNKYITLHYQDCSSQLLVIDKAIHFVKDHSRNYFHWMIECLPRMLIVNQVSEAKKFPLLIDANLAPQQLEALDMINKDKRQLIQLKNKHYCLVQDLYYPSQLSVIHDNLHGPVRYNEDVLYSPKALNFVRDFFYSEINIKNNSGFKKLYISRKNSLYRKIINENAIENLMSSHDFEIIFPEKLSFVEQVLLFSQAKIIVGQSGAGMANLLFAPQNCRVLIFVGNDKQTNLHVFHAFCDAIGVTVEYLVGRTKGDRSVHSDFSIDLKLLRNYINGL